MSVCLSLNSFRVKYVFAGGRELVLQVLWINDSTGHYVYTGAAKWLGGYVKYSQPSTSNVFEIIVEKVHPCCVVRFMLCGTERAPSIRETVPCVCNTRLSRGERMSGEREKREI
jgi:hypothetical protein